MRVGAIQWHGLAMLLAGMTALGVLTCLPAFRRLGDDRGDGRSVVALPPPQVVEPRRTVAVVAAFTVLSLLYVRFSFDLVNHLYGRLLNSLAGLAVREPGAIAGYTAHADLGARFLFAAYIVVLALVLKAGVWRRVLVATHLLLFLLLVAALDTTLIVVGVVVGGPFQPFSFEGNLVALFAGLLIVVRLTLTTFVLPRPVRIRRVRPRYLSDTVIMAAAITIAVLVALADALLVPSWVAGYDQTIAFLVVGLAVWTAFFPLIYLSLLLVHRLGPPEPALTMREARPRLDVLIPAYNEAEMIQATLQALDHAAAYYGGPVRVLLVDDGSTDQTAALASATMGTFVAAEGVVLDGGQHGGGHHGKSRALNLGLAAARADIIVRIDADALVDEEAFVFVPRWFEDPSVGAVSGVTIPRQEASWFRKMRVFECLYEFRFVRPALQCVDAIGCVPGIFGAVRRDAIIRLGGFTAGMNAEDADLTYNLGRLGYRVVLDRHIRVYEDVPGTYRGLRDQRLRWARGGLHVFARHAPFRAGLVGPRAWYSLTKMLLGRVTAPLRLFLLIYVVQLALLRPTVRHNFATLALVVLFSAIPVVLIRGGIAVAHGKSYLLPYLMLWYPYQFIKRLLIIESLLTMPTRPVNQPRWAWSRRDDVLLELPTK